MAKANEKKSTKVIPPVLTEEDEPLYFVPRRVSSIADLAGILSWVVLVGFVGDMVVKLLDVRSQITTNSLVLGDLLKELSFHSYLFTNIIEPLLFGLALFAVLQGVSAGLEMILEMTYRKKEQEKGK